jgi:NTP pyrophosphatase (non-canonical NTP hydrolase)
MQLREFQRLIEELYHEKDARRGVPRTFLWFTEEVGELAEAIRTGDRRGLDDEFADVLAWLTTLASLTGVDLEAVAARKYSQGCPRCRKKPCTCPEPAST